MPPPFRKPEASTDRAPEGFREAGGPGTKGSGVRTRSGGGPPLEIRDLLFGVRDSLAVAEVLRGAEPAPRHHQRLAGLSGLRQELRDREPRRREGARRVSVRRHVARLVEK